MVNFKIIICMEEEYIFGQMVEDMKVIILMIKNMVLEYINGVMVENMKENGKMVNNMVKVFI